MATLDQTLQSAQRAANRERKPMAVLNLNPFSPLYVVRDWDDRYTGDKVLVARVEPQEVGQ